MSSTITSRLLAIALCAISGAALAQMGPPPPKSDIAQRIEKALASNIRTDEERARDAKERKPVPTLEFFGLKPEMKVIELLPGAGWYTKVLGPVLAEKGQYSVAISAARLAPRLAEWKLDKVRVIEDKAPLKPSGQFGVFQSDGFDLQTTDADMVLTFRNYHNLNAPTRALLNQAVFKALKPGGVFLIVDHIGRNVRSVEQIDKLHRIDPALVKEQVLAAGFTLVAESDILRNPYDLGDKNVFDPTIRGHTDQFIFKFMRPK
jgi:predicted methyltransferase